MFKQLIKGTVFKLYDFIRPLIVIPFFIRSYGLESYGIYVQIILAATFLYPILDLGVGMGVQRFSEKLKEKNSTLEIFGTQRLIILIFCVVYFLIMMSANVRDLLFGTYQSAEIIISTFFYIVIFALNNTLQGVLRAKSEISKLVKYRSVFAVLEAILLLLVLQLSEVFSYRYIVIMVLCQFVYFLLLNKEAKGLITSYKIPFKISKQTKAFFKFSLAIIPTALIGWITSSSDRFFITDFFGSEYTGYYAAIGQYTGYMKLIVFPFTFVYFKEFSKLYDINFSNFKRLFNKSLLLCVGLSLLFLTLFYISRDLIFFDYLGLKYKPEFGKLVIWFLLSFFLINIASFLSTYMLVSKQTRMMLLAIALGALTNFTLNKFFLKDYDYTYSVYYCALSVSLQILIMLIFVIKNIKQNG